MNAAQKDVTSEEQGTYEQQLRKQLQQLQQQQQQALTSNIHGKQLQLLLL